MRRQQRNERFLCSTLLAALIWCVTGSLLATRQRAELRGVAKDAADELWRRGVCVLSSVVEPAKRASEVPLHLDGAKAAWGRPLSMTNDITAFAKGKRRIWVATDSALFAVDAATKQVISTYTHADGLPDEPTDALLSDGRFLWIIQRSRLSALDLASGKLVTERMPRFSHARVLADGTHAWVIADTGTYTYSHAIKSWSAAAPLPTGGDIKRFLAKGIWEGRRTEMLRGLLGEPVLLDADIYIPSRGSLFRFHVSSQKWSRISDDAWKVVPANGRLFFIGAFGVGEYDPTANRTASYKVGSAIPDGRPQFLVATEKNVWVALDAQALFESYAAGKGGVARFDFTTRQWTTYMTINGQKADQVTSLQNIRGQLWCATQNYTEVATIVAHPGMAHIKRTRPKIEGLSLHRYVEDKEKWDTITLSIPEGDARMILGQKGTRNEGKMVPRRLLAVAPASRAILCRCDMYPRQYFSGYYPTIGTFAHKDDSARAWTPSFTNHADQLDLQGEQPSVLLISGSHGRRIVLAAGHKKVLGLFRHQTGSIWAVSEGCLAWFDESEGRWRRVVDPPFRFYWRATAAVADTENIWVGSDCGIISRMDKRTYQCRALVCLPRRSVTQLALDENGTLWARTSNSECRRLPVEMKSVPKGPQAEVVKFDGNAWTAAKEWPAKLQAPENNWTFERRRNFLLRKTPANPSGKRTFFVAGVFRPRFLLEDPPDGSLWVSTYCGLVKLSTKK